MAINLTEWTANKLKGLREKFAPAVSNYFNATPIGQTVKATQNFFQPTQDVRIRDVVREIPQTINNFNRAPLNLANDIRIGAARGSYQLLGEAQKRLTGREAPTFQPATLPERFLFGREPIKPASTMGTELAQGFGASPNFARKIGMPLGIGLAIADIAPVTGGKGKAVIKGAGKAGKLAKVGRTFNSSLDRANTLKREAILAKEALSKTPAVTGTHISYEQFLKSIGKEPKPAPIASELRNVGKSELPGINPRSIGLAKSQKTAAKNADSFMLNNESGFYGSKEKFVPKEGTPEYEALMRVNAKKLANKTKLDSPLLSEARKYKSATDFKSKIEDLIARYKSGAKLLDNQESILKDLRANGGKKLTDIWNEANVSKGTQPLKAKIPGVSSLGEAIQSIPKQNATLTSKGAYQASYLAKKYGYDPKFVSKLLKTNDETLVERAMGYASDAPDLKSKEAYVTNFVKTKGYTETPPIKVAPQQDVPPITQEFPNAKAIEQPKPIVEPKPLVVNKPLLEQLPKPETITDANMHVIETARGRGVIVGKLNEAINSIKAEGLDRLKLGKMWDGEIPVEKGYEKHLTKLKAIYDEVYNIRATKGALGYKEGMPHVFSKEKDELLQFFNTHSNSAQIVDELMTDPHRLHFSGTGVDFEPDPFKAVMESGTRAIQDYLKPRSQVVKEIVEHVNKAEPNKVIDYVEKLGAEIATAEKKVVDYINRARLPIINQGKTLEEVVSSSPILQRNNLMEKIGFQHPEIYTAYRRVIDTKDLMPRYADEVEKIVASGDVNAIIKYFETKMPATEGFAEQAMSYIQKMGIKSFGNKMLGSLEKHNLSSFMETIKQYEFRDPKVKIVINKFIDQNLKLEKTKQTLLDTIANGANRMFSMAQIGGNLKVAMVQILDTTRLPVNYSIPDIATGIKNAITGTFNLERKYGFQGIKSNYTRIINQSAKVQNLPSKILETVLYGPLQAVESFKNRIYIAASEAQGIKKGLSGDALTNYVRGVVFKRGNIAHTENVPLFLKDSAANRAFLQYSQFAIKNIVEIADTAKEQSVAKAAALLASNAVGAMIIAYIVGAPMKRALQGIFPAGVGPVLSVPVDFVKQYLEYQEEKEKGYSTAGTTQRVKDMTIGNFVPAGAQYNKTSKFTKIMQEGYDQTPTGRVKYLAPESKWEQFKGYTLGKSSTNVNKDYYKNDQVALGDIQSEYVKQQGSRKNAYDQIMQDRADKKEQDRIEKKLGEGEATLINGKIVRMENGELKRIDIGKVLSLPQSTSADKLAYNKAVYAAAVKALDVPQEQQDKAFSALGVSKEDALYYKDASRPDDEQQAVIVDVLSGSEDYLETLKPMRRTVGGKQLLTDTIVNKLVKEGVISKANGNYLKQISDLKDGTVKLKAGSAGGAKKPKKLKAAKKITFAKIKVSSPKRASVAKIKAPSVKGIIKPVKRQKLKALPKTQTIQQVRAKLTAKR